MTRNSFLIRKTKLTLILLTCRIWWAPNNASRWQMGFNWGVWRVKSSYTKAKEIKPPSKYPSTFYVPPEVLAHIPLQSYSDYVHKNYITNNHVINFAKGTDELEPRVTSPTPCDICPRAQYNNANQHQHRVLMFKKANVVYRGAEKSLARPGRKQATATKLWLLQATQKQFRRLSV